jgi:hypothetical protein
MRKRKWVAAPVRVRSEELGFVPVRRTLLQKSNRRHLASNTLSRAPQKGNRSSSERGSRSHGIRASRGSLASENVTANRIGVAMKGAGSGQAQDDVIASPSVRNGRGNTPLASVESGSGNTSGVYEGSLSMEGTSGSRKQGCSRISGKVVLGSFGSCQVGSEGFPTGSCWGSDRGISGRRPLRLGSNRPMSPPPGSGVRVQVSAYQSPSRGREPSGWPDQAF